MLRCPYNVDLGDTCLTDAQLRTVRALSDDMNAEQRPAISVTHQLEQAMWGGVDVRACEPIEARPTHEDRSALPGSRLGQADAAQLGDRVDPVRQEVG